ncbi:unnamed protein product [Brassicogethes aeneus]|uniref:THAP-type domain-containing protein n=1 Tax=Brassicogethes aeneus TaxID=1431903 RepID=A0A9P0FPY4_BRAAE|nr:unnamed protein product [Brassicogethes aeneus]
MVIKFLLQFCATWEGDLMFFRFPKEVNILKVWQSACGRKDNFNVLNSRICLKHFKNSDYARNLKHELLGYSPKNCRLIKPEAVPTENLPRKSSCSTAGPSSSTTSRDVRAEKKNRSQLVDILLSNQNIETEKSTGSGEHNTIYLGGEESFFKDSNVKSKNVEIVTRDVGINTELDKRDKIITGLKDKIAQLEGETSAMKTLFTANQIKNYNTLMEDKDGHRAYRLLLNEGFPLPAVSTLRSWLKKIKGFTRYTEACVQYN